MSTSKATIESWFNEGNTGKRSHMIVATDDFDYEDYPIYVDHGVDPQTKRPTNGDRVMECYSYELPLGSQLAEFRANHWELPKSQEPQGSDL